MLKIIFMSTVALALTSSNPLPEKSVDTVCGCLEWQRQDAQHDYYKGVASKCIWLNYSKNGTITSRNKMYVKPNKAYTVAKVKQGATPGFTCNCN